MAVRSPSARGVAPPIPRVEPRLPSPPSPRAFVAATLGSCLGLLAAVLALNLAVDPYALAQSGLVATAVENDRSLKLDLIDRLKRQPETLILGSSRARQAEPAQLQRLTGHTAFNAAVTGGTAADAWVMTRYVADRFPQGERRYVWFVDVAIATNGINPQLAADLRSRKYLSGSRRRLGLSELKTYLGLSATGDSLRVLRACVPDDCDPTVRYNADGSLSGASVRNLPEQSKHLNRDVARLVASVRSHPYALGGKLSPDRYVFFERTLRFMNEQGARPVIVLNPIHPVVLAEHERYGFAARRVARAYLARLHKRFDFVVVDGQDIQRWGGSPRDFANPTHINERNMRRLLAYVVAQSGGALR